MILGEAILLTASTLSEVAAMTPAFRSSGVFAWKVGTDLKIGGRVFLLIFLF
jgi:hypothetical protein